MSFFGWNSDKYVVRLEKTSPPNELSGRLGFKLKLSCRQGPRKRCTSTHTCTTIELIVLHQTLDLGDYLVSKLFTFHLLLLLSLPSASFDLFLLL